MYLVEEIRKRITFAMSFRTKVIVNMSKIASIITLEAKIKEFSTTIRIRLKCVVTSKKDIAAINIVNLATTQTTTSTPFNLKIIPTIKALEVFKEKILILTRRTDLFRKFAGFSKKEIVKKAKDAISLMTLKSNNTPINLIIKDNSDFANFTSKDFARNSSKTIHARKELLIMQISSSEFFLRFAH